MKDLFHTRNAAAGIIILAAVLATTPAAQTSAQTSKNFGKALTKAYKGGSRKELPSLVPQKELPMPTFSGPKVSMPNTQGAQKQKQAPPSGVTLGYGNSMLFKDMDKLKRDSVQADTAETKR